MGRIQPLSYEIRLEPDLSRFLFTATTRIRLHAEEPVRAIRLDASELAVWRCRAGHDGGLLDCPFSVDPHGEALRIHLPEEMKGDLLVEAEYAGRINDRMAGFYRSRFTHEGKHGFVAVTQFQESDARRALPCLDHPRAKARFDIEIIVEGETVALSNMPVAEEEELEGGRRRIRFKQTPRMSTYLLFFGVGRFEFAKDPVDPRLRAVTPPGLSRFAGLSLEFARESLRFFEQYYEIPYPLPKLDLIAIADFAFGAMENWGAITFRENLMLHVADETSKTAVQRIFEVVAHEIAHQWFGNLVTPSDWRFLWLNESFATLFACRAVAHARPDWRVWEQFLDGEATRALDRDAMKLTVPIEMPGHEQAAINEVTAPILYDKGACILRQVEGAIGQDRFRKGLRVYLNRHAYGCASSRDLWEAVEEAAQGPVTRLMRSWIEQPGHPLVEVRREGSTLVLKQSRFSYLHDHELSGPSWVIPVKIKIFGENRDETETAVLFDTEAMEMSIEPDVLAYKLNSGQTGFYRVKYESPADLEALGRLTARKRLPPEDRWGLQSDLYALVKSDQVRLSEYLDFLAYYEQEDAFLPVIGIASNLFEIHRVLGDGLGSRAASLGKGLLEGLFERVGFDPRPNEPHTTSLLRDRVLFQAVVYGSQRATAFGLDRFDAMTKGGRIHPDIRRSVMQVGAWTRGAAAFAWLADTFERETNEHERMNILAALACFREWLQLEEALAFILKRVPSRNRFVPLCQMALNNPCAGSTMWDWFTSHLKELEQLHPLHLERVITYLVPSCGIGREQELESFLAAYTKQNPRLGDTIRLALEALAVFSRLKKACS